MHAFRWSLQLYEKGCEIETYIVDYELIDAIFWGKTSDQLRHMASNTEPVSSEESESSKDEENEEESEESNDDGDKSDDEKRGSSDDDDSKKENDKKPNEEPDDGNSDDSTDDRNDSDEEPETEDENDDSSDTKQDDDVHDSVLDEDDQMSTSLATTSNITTDEHKDIDGEPELDIDPEERQDSMASAQKTSQDNSEAHQNEVVDGGRHISNRIDSQEDSDDGSKDEKDADFLEDASQSEDNGKKGTDKQQRKGGTTVHKSRSKSSGIKKKRKRSPSPPWKSAAAEVPSTVEDEYGRRKSGRVMSRKR